MRGIRKWLVGFLLFGVLAVGVWQRQALVAWWHVRALVQAGEAQRDECVQRVSNLDEAAVARLIAALEQEDETVCANVRAGLVALAEKWGAHDARTARLLVALHGDFAQLSIAGRRAALGVAVAALGDAALGDAAAGLPAPLTSAAGKLLEAAQPVAPLRPQVLRLAAALLGRTTPDPRRADCRELALTSLADEEPETRIAALRIVVHASLRDDGELVNRALPLLADRAAEVRRAALAALGPMAHVLTEEDLLPLLHDADAEVRHLCELALRGRGLQDSHVMLARLISHAQPLVRLQVLHELGATEGIDAGVWLRRLSQDPSPAVRAAAIRAAADQKADLGGRLVEMERQDASATVRELAAHYIGLEGSAVK
jgi:HEAT repeat protein